MPTSEAATALASRILGNSTDDKVLQMLIGGAKRQAAGEPEPEDENDDTANTGETDGDDEETPFDQDSEGDDDADEGDEGEEGDDDTDDDVEEELETIEYSDDDVISVMVDGEEREVTLKDLKRQYSGEGAIEKRLQEATEYRKAAAAERQAVQSEIEANRLDLLNSVAALDSVLFAPLVPPPDPNMRFQNPERYIQHLDAYNDDQRRIQHSQGQVAQLFTQERDRKMKAVTTYREEQTKLLLAHEPGLADPKIAAEFRDDLNFMAEHYGFNANDLATVDNHAMLLVARDAGRYQKLMKGKKTGTVPTGGEKTIKRRLTAGTKGAAPKPTDKQSKAYSEARAKAAKSGSVDDVTNMLLTNATRGKTAAKRR